MAQREPDKFAINAIIKHYKQSNGSPNYMTLLSVPIGDRLTALATKNMAETAAVVTVGLTMAFASMNLSRPMNAIQIVDLAGYIIDEAEQDQLSLEDVMVFLQGIVFGKWGKNYESMDIPKFMTMFESFREERHQTYHELKMNKHLEFKSLGTANRSVEPDRLTTLVDTIAGRYNSLKDYRPDKERANINSETFKNNGTQTAD